jgi:TRAP-type mannitol/chloroaromatic compound transport system permease large subunit
MNQQPLPGASNALTMGIISIIGAFTCCGPFAIIFSIVGLSNANKAERLYREHPKNYSGYESVRTGRILSYVGMVLALIYLVLGIIYFGIIAAYFTSELL